MISSADQPDFFINASTEVRLGESRTFDLAIVSNDMPLDSLLGLVVTDPKSLAEGKVDVRGTIRGALPTGPDELAQMDGDFRIASPSLRLLGVDLGLLEHRLTLSSDRLRMIPLDLAATQSETSSDMIVSDVDIQYRVTPERIEIPELFVAAFGGEMVGKAEVARNKTGMHRVIAQWRDMSPRIQIPFEFLGRTVRLSGMTSGQVDWSVPANLINLPAQHQGVASIQIESLKIGSESLGSITLEIQIRDSSLSVKGDGTLLGGKMSLTGSSPLTATTQWNQVPNLIRNGQLSMTDVSVRESVRVLAKSQQPRFSGRISGTTEFELDANQELVGKSSWTLRDFSVDQQSVARSLMADFSLSATTIDIQRIRGVYAGGQIRASGQWELGSGQRMIDVRLTRGRGDRLLLPIDEEASLWIGGLVSGAPRSWDRAAGRSTPFASLGTSAFPMAKHFVFRSVMATVRYVSMSLVTR